jgi:hypothetical protein
MTRRRDQQPRLWWGGTINRVKTTRIMSELSEFPTSTALGARRHAMVKRTTKHKATRRTGFEQPRIPRDPARRATSQPMEHGK